MTPAVAELMLKCQEARLAFNEQDKKMREPVFNGRYGPKADRLLKEWKNAERALLNEIYQKIRG
jgi:hypothetical protein